MKQIINLPSRERILLNELETKIKSARNSNDYICINFGRRESFIKVSFEKDQTYIVGFNFYNMEFQFKLNLFIKQHPKAVVGQIAQFLFTWVNKLNAR